MVCGLCGRRMSGKWNNDQAYYLSRFPIEYALANHITHPKNVYLREADMLGQVDDWLAEMFAPANIDATLDVLAGQAAQLEDPATRDKTEAARARIAEYDAQISRYRASLDAGGDPAVIGPWIAETQARKVTAQAEIRTATGRRPLSRDDIAAFADLPQVVREADPADKAELYAQLNLTLTYQPDQRLAEATVKPGLDMRKGFVSEGGLEPPRRWYIPESGIYHQSKLTQQGRPPRHFAGQERRRCRAAQRPGPRELRKRRAVSRNSAAGPGGPDGLRHDDDCLPGEAR